MDTLLRPGSSESLAANRSSGIPGFLRPLIRHYGLDPGFRVRWLVEGPTEEGFIVQYVDRLEASIREFVNIRQFGGDGSFQKELAAIDADLKAARAEQCFVTLTFDESKGARGRLEDLIASGLVNFPFVLNTPDFELGQLHRVPACGRCSVLGF